LEGQDSFTEYTNINVNEFDFEKVFDYIEKDKLKHLKFILIQFDFRLFFFTYVRLKNGIIKVYIIFFEFFK
jgi:hypothetical protein